MPHGHDVKRNDVRTLRWTLNADLSAATAVRIIARLRREGGDVTDPPLIDAQATVEQTSETESTVAYTVTATDTAEAARWNVEVEASFADGTLITFPDDGYELVTVHPDLG